MRREDPNRAHLSRVRHPRPGRQGPDRRGGGAAGQGARHRGPPQGRHAPSSSAATAASPPRASATRSAKGLTSTGLNVLDIGVVPTPLTYFAANTLPVDGLAMITGSHNPPEYNGFKIGAGKTTFHGHEIQELRKLIEARRLRDGAKPGTVERVRHHHALQPLRPADGEGRPQGDEDRHRRGQRHRRRASRCRCSEAMGFDVVAAVLRDGRAPSPTTTRIPTVVENLEDLIAAVKQREGRGGHRLRRRRGPHRRGRRPGQHPLGRPADDPLRRARAEGAPGRGHRRRGEVLATRSTTTSRSTAASRSCGRPATRSSRRR